MSRIGRWCDVQWFSKCILQYVVSVLHHHKSYLIERVTERRMQSSDREMALRCFSGHHLIHFTSNCHHVAEYFGQKLISFNAKLSSVLFSGSVMSDSLRPHEPQHTRPPCPSPTPGVNPNSCPLSLWCHLTISSSVIPFSSCLQSFLTSGAFQMSQLFASSVQNTGVSALTSVLPRNT